MAVYSAIVMATMEMSTHRTLLAKTHNFVENDVRLLPFLNLGCNALSDSALGSDSRERHIASVILLEVVMIGSSFLQFVPWSSHRNAFLLRKHSPF